MTDKRDKIIEAAVSLFVRDGFWNTSTASIAKHAGVATGTLFNYFPSKDELINQVYSDTKLMAHAAMFGDYPKNAPLEETLGHAWRRYVEWSLEHPQRYQLMEQLRLSELVRPETREQLAQEYAFFVFMIEEAVTNGVLKRLPVELHLEILIGQLNAVITYLRSEDVPVEERNQIIKTSISAYWSGVKS
jgi:AcrR family transcriptional regulator